jgi:hypothetical protein
MERDALIGYFRERNPHYAPLVQTMFLTGLRTGEATGLRWGDVDLRSETMTVRRSRTMGEDNPPKTKRSRRTIRLLADVVSVLRAHQPLHAAEDVFVFTTQVGTPLDEEAFVAKHWRRAIRATGIRPRKFYATRHTFISWALTRGANLEWIADYCGTSVEMIERHYGRYVHGDDGQLALLSTVPSEPARALAVNSSDSTGPSPEPGGRPPRRREPRSSRRGGTFAGTFPGASVSRRTTRAEGGRFELPRVSPPWRFSRPLP